MLAEMHVWVRVTPQCQDCTPKPESRLEKKTQRGWKTIDTKPNVSEMMVRGTKKQRRLSFTASLQSSIKATPLYLFTSERRFSHREGPQRTGFMSNWFSI